MRPAAGEHTGGLCGYDAELRQHNEILRRAGGIRLHDLILDIGCGTGQTTRQAAWTARAGSAFGVGGAASSGSVVTSVGSSVRADHHRASDRRYYVSLDCATALF